MQRLRDIADRARPVALAQEQVLPVLPALAGLLPGGLQRGTTVQIAAAGSGIGSTSLALAVLAGPSAAGSWTAAVGVPALGLAAAAGFGVDLGRLVLVASPPPEQWATVVATLLDAFDVVLARPVRRVGSVEGRRLVARARERGSVLVRLGASTDWPEAADASLTVVASAWEGLGTGHGHLRARRVTVEAGGRRANARVRRAELWLPGTDGSLSAGPELFRASRQRTRVAS